MARACSSAPNRFGNSGRYLKVRNCASENGLSLLTRGREWLAAMPRSEKQQRDELAAHGRAAVGVNRELLRLDALLRAGLLDQALGQVSALLDRHHPAHDVAAEEVEDHIQRVVEIGGPGPSAW